MAERAMTMVFCYDIASSRVRARVARTLEDCAVRVQESVFEVRLTQSRSRRLFEALKKELEPGDSLRAYAIAAAGLERCMVAGGGPVPEDGDFWLL